MNRKDAIIHMRMLAHMHIGEHCVTDAEVESEECEISEAMAALGVNPKEWKVADNA